MTKWMKKLLMTIIVLMIVNFGIFFALFILYSTQLISNTIFVALLIIQNLCFVISLFYKISCTVKKVKAANGISNASNANAEKHIVLSSPIIKYVIPTVVAISLLAPQALPDVPYVKLLSTLCFIPCCIILIVMIIWRLIHNIKIASK